MNCTHSNDLSALRSERLSAVLVHVARHRAKSELGGRGGVGEDAVDDRAALLASGAENGDDLLDHDGSMCSWW